MKRKISDESLWNQLGNVVSMAAEEDQIIWTIFGVFWAANAVLLVALFNTDKIPEEEVVIVVSVMGTFLSFIWFLIQRRAINWLKYYEKIINKIEKKLSIPENLSMSSRRNELLFYKVVGRGVRVRILMILSGLLSSVGWISTLIVYVIKVFSH